MYLFRKGRISATALHGTLEPWSIGTNASSGCIRMFSEDVIDLYQRCPIGTRVLVLQASRCAGRSTRPPPSDPPMRQTTLCGRGDRLGPCRDPCRLRQQFGGGGSARPDARPSLPDAGGISVEPGTEQDFMVNVGRRTFFKQRLGRARRHGARDARQAGAVAEPISAMEGEAAGLRRRSRLGRAADHTVAEARRCGEATICVARASRPSACKPRAMAATGWWAIARISNARRRTAASSPIRKDPASQTERAGQTRAANQR